MMYSPYTLPPVFHFVFATLEPLSTLSGFLYPYLSPERFLNEQVPTIPLIQHTGISDNVRGSVMQLANCYLLLCMCALAVLRTTSEKTVVRNFLIALLLGDIGHLYFTWRAVGTEIFFDPTRWNALTGGNVGATIFLLLTRILYLIGWGFTPQSPINKPKKRA